MTAEINQAFGALTEGVFVAGFTLERAFRKLEWLLDDDRWKTVGAGFNNIDAFLAMIKLDDFKIVAEQRKKIAARIKELQPKASNATIAKVLGKGKSTIQRDVNPNGSGDAKTTRKNKGTKTTSDPNGSATLSGPAAAKAVEARETKEERKIQKVEARNERERVLGRKLLALPHKKYGVILADPEWHFIPWWPAGSFNSSAENHYPTSSLEEIKARDVSSIAADDSVLFLWGTVPMTPQALEVMTAWGFRYVTNFVWVKDRPGTGYWNRNRHEILFVGVKGHPPIPAPGDQLESIIEARRPFGEAGTIARTNRALFSVAT